VIGPRLTHRQRLVLHAVHSLTRRRGYPPSLREITEETGLSSHGSVRWHLQQLEQNGLLVRSPGRRRSVRLGPRVVPASDGLRLIVPTAVCDRCGAARPVDHACQGEA
jgi:SOS-response transcriptional repressor LexA